MDQLLFPLLDAQQPVFPQLSGGQLHTDGCKHRLCYRYLQPIHGTEKTDAASQSHHSGIESGVSDHHYIRFHAGGSRAFDWVHVL